MKIQGKYNSAHIYTDNINSESLSQIYNMLNIPCFANSHIAIMPDVHVGKGSVVGFTMTQNEWVMPGIIGVDIGCGVEVCRIGATDVDLPALDAFVRNSIPSGRDVHADLNGTYINSTPALLEMIQRIGPKDQQRFLKSLGTLGGGNHFIELDKDADGELYLIIHSGSRNLGLQVCRYHQRVAKNATIHRFNGASAYAGMEYMSMKEGGEQYLEDVETTQLYAQTNRQTMARIIVEGFFGLKWKECNSFSSAHNYINHNDRVVRKGAISAQKDEQLIVPLNMRDGCIIGRGKGNADWNFSAPHGAGRLLRRGESKELISLEEFTESMAGIYSSSVHCGTIDESPMAYKDAEEIINLIGDTISIEKLIRPVYNFKA